MENINRKICKACGNGFEKEYNAQKYCSDKCKIKYYEQGRKNKTLICMNCNQSFIGNRANKFCCSQCRGEHLKANLKTRVVKCVECDKEFFTKDWAHNEITCSKKCRMQHGKKYWGYDKKCVVCGSDFKTPRKSQRVCSNSCEASTRSQQARDRNGDSFPNQRARVEYKRRQRKIKTLVEKVELNRLIVRDEGICKICGELVDLRVHYNHHLAPTNDHIIPLALGGETSYKNCQLAHRGCNSRKSHFMKVEEVRKWQDQQKAQMS